MILIHQQSIPFIIPRSSWARARVRINTNNLKTKSDMKKIKVINVLGAAIAVFMLSSCTDLVKGVFGGGDNQESDSLRNVIEQKDNEINDLMGTFNEIQQGFDLINAAEGRVNEMREGGSSSANIRENMDFIQQTLDENKRKIEELTTKLNSSSINSAKMKEAINTLTKQLNEKTAEVEKLRAQLAEKEQQIQELTGTVTTLRDENTQVRQEKEATEQIARTQDTQLNTAWYAIGTSKELKNQRILSHGDVLEGDYNKSYFTKIDIRKVTVIPMESKHAKILTTHPAGSYTLLKDSKGEYALHITDVAQFWSVSKYLVVRVR